MSIDSGSSLSCALSTVCSGTGRSEVKHAVERCFLRAAERRGTAAAAAAALMREARGA